MIYEQFINSKGLLDQLTRATAELRALGAYTLFMEIIARKVRTSAPDDNPIEAAALRDAFQRGYYEALSDIFDFENRFGPTVKFVPQMNFGASEALLRDGDISEAEYQALTGRQPPTD